MDSEISRISENVLQIGFLQTNIALDRDFPAHLRAFRVAITVLIPLLHYYYRIYNITCFILIHYNVILYFLPINALYCKIALRVERF